MYITREVPTFVVRDDVTEMNASLRTHSGQLGMFSNCQTIVLVIERTVNIISLMKTLSVHLR